MDKAGIGQLLRGLVSVDGPSGAEGKVAQLVQSLARDIADEVQVDVMGSVTAVKRGIGDGGKILLAAHLDEIGLIVTKVEDGYIHVDSVGGVDPRSALGQEVTVYPSGPGSDAYPDGLPGYIGSLPPHVTSPADRKKVIPMHELRVDLGLSPQRLADGLVRVGDRIVWRGPHTELLEGRVATKALDNRASVAAMLGALSYLRNMQHTWDVYAVATAKEEIGLQGALTSAFRVMPDVAVAIDVTFADTPGVDGRDTVAMDKGPAIAWGPNLHPGVVKGLRAAADTFEIPYITEPAPGRTGTDAWALQVVQEGIPTGLTSIPIRYMHSTVELAAVADIDRTARLLAAFISRLDQAFLENLSKEV